MVIDADYVSCLAANIHIDPLLREYLIIAGKAYLDDNPPASTSRVVLVENEPNFRGTQMEPSQSSTSPSPPSATTSQSDSQPYATAHHTMTNIPIFFLTTSTTPESRHHHTHAVAATFQLPLSMGHPRFWIWSFPSLMSIQRHPLQDPSCHRPKPARP
jgi:hypothetical protein